MLAGVQPLSFCAVCEIIVIIRLKKVQEGNYQEMVQSERNSHSINRGVGKKTKMTLRNLYKENIL